MRGWVHLHLGLAGLFGLALVAGSAQNLQDCRTELCRLITDASLPELRWPDFRDQQMDIVNFYAPSGFALAWVREGAATAQAIAIIEVLKNADSKGLDSEDYDGPRWDARLAKLPSGEFGEAAASRLDLALTVSVMRYASDLCVGRVNPNNSRFRVEVNKRQYDLPSWVRQWLVHSSDPKDALEQVEPPFDVYRRTEKALQFYLALARDDEAAALPISAKPLKPGESYPDLARLATRLRDLGDLPAPLLAPESQIYEGALVQAVKHFQLRHGLDPDGRIGNQTWQQLNTPLHQRVRQMQLTLERWRWVPREFPRPPIVVNIPEFRLRAFDGSYQTELNMAVVVGKAHGHQTPAFASELKAVIFSPYWNVPISIQRAELVPALKRDPSYLVKNDYEVVTHRGEFVTNDVVTQEILNDLRTGKLAIRQVPGPKNALGGVTFMFPNENDVYMHDTPARALFSQSRRDFSHGCIRVERALDLALWVLRDYPQWPRENILEAMKAGTRLQVDLARPIPVLIVYGTAVVTAEGMPYFFEDIYGLDAQLERELEQAHSKSDGPPASAEHPPSAEHPANPGQATNAGRGPRPRE